MFCVLSLAMGLNAMASFFERFWRLAIPATAEPFVSPLEAMRFRYLIGTDVPGPGRDGEITEVSYNVRSPLPHGVSVKYCNLFDEDNTGRYGPYLYDSDTAAQYGEGQIDPAGPGWQKNISFQVSRAAGAGFLYIEWDNPDAYRVADVIVAYDMAQAGGLRVLSKNPELSDHNEDTLPLVAHPAVVGVIVERGAGSPSQMHALRKRAGKPDLPIWFVSHGNGRRWAQEMAAKAKPYSNMSVTYSMRGEYGSSEDVNA